MASYTAGTPAVLDTAVMGTGGIAVVAVAAGSDSCGPLLTVTAAPTGDDVCRVVRPMAPGMYPVAADLQALTAADAAAAGAAESSWIGAVDACGFPELTARVVAADAAACSVLALGIAAAVGAEDGAEAASAMSLPAG